VTHPDVKRYFMTILEAVQLVLQAATVPEAARRIAILEMGQPARILDLAEHLIRLAGLVPHRDIQIVFTGLRPGEKLNEELVADREATVPTSVEKIRVVERNGACGSAVEAGLQRLLAALARGASADLPAAVCALVPEYVPWQRQAVGATVETAVEVAPRAPRRHPIPALLSRPGTPHTAATR